MNSFDIKQKLETRLRQPDRQFIFDKKRNRLRIEDKNSGKGITLSLPGLIHKYENGNTNVIDDIVYHVEEALNVMGKQLDLTGEEKQIFPVIRATSFPTETKEGRTLVYEDHTAETRIYYAVDLGRSYQLIDDGIMEEENWQKEKIREVSQFHLRSLKNPFKKDEVRGNTFYFINENDGYDASRILNQSLVNEMNKRAKGTLTAAIPHQDVLIFGDIINDTGYDVLGQMTMSFFSNGSVPITALPFMCKNGELEPIFIMARKKPEQ